MEVYSIRQSDLIRNEVSEIENMWASVRFNNILKVANVSLSGHERRQIEQAQKYWKKKSSFCLFNIPSSKQQIRQKSLNVYEVLYNGCSLVLVTKLLLLFLCLLHKWKHQLVILTVWRGCIEK